MAKVLAVDDEAQILTALRRGLGRAGHEVVVANDAASGLAAALTTQPDVVLLDLRLPDLDGIEVVRRLRAWTTVPILLLSGAGTHRARVAALDAGADDFIDKPFAMEELRARVGAVLRRHAPSSEAGRSVGQAGRGNGSGRLELDDVVVDLPDRQVTVGGEPVRLTPTEWRLLEILVTHAGKLLTYQQVIRAVWDDRHGDESRDALRTHLRGLRRKLGDNASDPRYIATDPGVGYRWVAGAV